MPPDHPLIEAVRRTNAARDLFPSGERVLVAVSGGPDSLALLHALCAMRDELAVELVAAHLDHRMRGEAGEAEAAFVRETAAAWGLAVEAGGRDVPALARRTGLSLEQAGRAARYHFFGRAARRSGCGRIATAHTADDRAETILLHLLRGTGLDGLAGFPAVRPLRPGRPTPVVIRPLIDVTRQQVVDYCAAHRLQPRHDPTNESPAYLRNRVRRELLPLLEDRYSPAVRRHLLRLARLAEEETALLDAQALDLLRSAILPAAGGPDSPRRPGDPERAMALQLSIGVLLAAPAVLSRRALRWAIQKVLPGPAPELAVVERLLSLARGERPGFPLPGGRFTARATPRALILEPSVSVPPFEVWEPVHLAVPGATPLPWTAGTIIACLETAQQEIGAGGEAAPAPHRDEGMIRGSGSEESAAALGSLRRTPPHVAVLDRSRLVGPLTVRPPRPGDRIQPLGMQGHRKLQDILTDHKTPRAARRRVPVVSDAEKIVWVAGHCVSEAARIRPATAEWVRLVWEGWRLMG